MIGDEKKLLEEYIEIANNYLGKKNIKEAIKSMSKAYELFPDNIGVIGYLAGLECQEKNYDEEIRLRYKMIEIMEAKQYSTGYIYNDLHPYFMLGNTLSLVKRYKEAIEITKKALALVEDEDLNVKATLHSRLCNEYFQSGDYEKALLYADKSLEVDSGNQHLEEIKKTILERGNSKK